MIECGAFGSFLGKLDIEIENGKMKEYRYELMDVDPAKYPADKKCSNWSTMPENLSLPSWTE